jgi:uncharacterized membrane protein YgcG
MITPDFLRDLSIHGGVYDLGAFMDFFLQSPVKMGEIFPGYMMLSHGACIANCGMLARWLKESPTSPLPIQLRTNHHPDWYHVSPDMITIDRWTPTVVSTFSMYWSHGRASYEREIGDAASHASKAYRSQSIKLHAAYQLAQNHSSPMEDHYTQGFSDHMKAIQQASSTLSNTGGNSTPHPTRQETHPKRQEPHPSSNSTPHPTRQETHPTRQEPHPIPQISATTFRTEVKTEDAATVRDHPQFQRDVELTMDITDRHHHGTKRTPSIQSSSQSGRGKHKKHKHKRPQVPSRFVPDPPKTYVDGKLATMTEDIGPSDLSDSDSSNSRRHRHRKARHHHRRSRQKHGRHGGSGGSGSGSSGGGSSSSSSSSLSRQSWDFDDFFDKDGIWKPPKGHPAWHRVKSHTRKIKTVKRPKRVTLSKWDGNPITCSDKMFEVRNALTDVGLGYLVDKTFLKYWTTYGNKNLLIQARVQ